MLRDVSEFCSVTKDGSNESTRTVSENVKDNIRLFMSRLNEYSCGSVVSSINTATLAALYNGTSSTKFSLLSAIVVFSIAIYVLCSLIARERIA